jgi:ABC-type nickel/cobalt efflux system permease component RcnA
MAQPSEGVKTRSEIDIEIVRGLLLANGGGAVALLTFLPKAFEKGPLSSLAMPVVLALFVFHLGIVAAIVHNHYRRRCSLEYEFPT